MGTENGIDGKLETVCELLACEPSGGDFTTTLDRLLRAKAAFHEALAERFQAVLNRHLQEAPRGTLEERRKAATEASAALHALGLAIRCPKTGEAVTLRADGGSGGRYQLAEIGNVTYGRTMSFVEPRPLALIVSPCQSALVEHRHRQQQRRKYEGEKNR